MRSVSEVAIRDLVVGQPLEFDLLDPAGRVLLNAGHVLNQRTIERWKDNGFARVFIAKLSDSTEPGPANLEPTSIASAYNSEVLAKVDHCSEVAKERLTDIVNCLVVDDQPHTTGLHSIFAMLAEAIDSDSDAVLYRAADGHGTLATSRNSALVNRSLLMSTIGATAAACMGLTVDECTTVALAGLMHDVSLFDEMLGLQFQDMETADERQSHLNRHSITSAELLERCPGINANVLVVMSQVHEQVDGSGFPNRTAGHHLSAPSRILNLIDAYLTLTDPNEKQAYLPADALAYLAGRTGARVFDYDCMRALLKALSVYSVGSRVILDDNQTATVIRSTKTDPLSPVVRCDQSQAVVDLRESNLRIREPLPNPALPNRRRMSRSQLTRVLWKPSFYRPIDSPARRG